MDRELRSDELNSILSLSKGCASAAGLTRAGGSWMTRWYLPAKLESALTSIPK